MSSDAGCCGCPLGSCTRTFISFDAPPTNSGTLFISRCIRYPRCLMHVESIRASKYIYPHTPAHWQACGWIDFWQLVLVVQVIVWYVSHEYSSLGSTYPTISRCYRLPRFRAWYSCVLRVGRMRPAGIAATVFPEFVACEIAVQERPRCTSAVKAAVRRNRVQKRTKCPSGLVQSSRGWTSSQIQRCTQKKGCSHTVFGDKHAGGVSHL